MPQGVLAHGRGTMPSEPRLPELVLFHSPAPSGTHSGRLGAHLGAKEVPPKPHILPFPLHICVLGAQPWREGWSHELERRDEEVVNVASLPNLVFCHSR